MERLTVDHGVRLSQQMRRHHRHGHWAAASEMVKAQRGEQVILLKENEAACIPSCTRHRLEIRG